MKKFLKIITSLGMFSALGPQVLQVQSCDVEKTMASVESSLLVSLKNIQKNYSGANAYYDNDIYILHNSTYLDPEKVSNVGAQNTATNLSLQTLFTDTNNVPSSIANQTSDALTNRIDNLYLGNGEIYNANLDKGAIDEENLQSIYDLWLNTRMDILRSEVAEILGKAVKDLSLEEIVDTYNDPNAKFNTNLNQESQTKIIPSAASDNDNDSKNIDFPVGNWFKRKYTNYAEVCQSQMDQWMHTIAMDDSIENNKLKTDTNQLYYATIYYGIVSAKKSSQTVKLQKISIQYRFLK